MQDKTTTEKHQPSQTVESEFVTLSGFSVRRGTLPLRERAEELQCHPVTLKRQCDEGALAYCRIGDRRYLSEKHVTDWLARLERPAKNARKAA